MTHHPSRLHGGALLVLALTCASACDSACSSAQAAPGYPPLTHERSRITDPAVAADLAAFAALERRIVALGDTAGAERTHARALASGWLVLARDQYRRNDRSGLAECVFFPDAWRRLAPATRGDVLRVEGRVDETLGAFTINVEHAESLAVGAATYAETNASTATSADVDEDS